MLCTIELTEREQKIFDEVMEQVDKAAVYLAGLSHEERLDWLKEHQYSRPISFEREIGGTVYTVNAHFGGDTAETPPRKKLIVFSPEISHVKVLKFCVGCGMIMLPCNSYHIRLRKGAYLEEKAAK